MRDELLCRFRRVSGDDTEVAQHPGGAQLRLQGVEIYFRQSRNSSSMSERWTMREHRLSQFISLGHHRSPLRLKTWAGHSSVKPTAKVR
jgi:hypothetical protein